jgi:hypothetical protein
MTVRDPDGRLFRLEAGSEVHRDTSSSSQHRRM